MKNKTRELWKNCPFPELYETTISTPLCLKTAQGDHKSELILIHHLHEVSVPYIKALAKSYKLKKIIGIPYSSVEEVVEELEKDFDVVVPKTLGEIKEIVKEVVLSTSNPLIIAEIGGYTSEISEFLDKQKHVLGIVEDTNQGHWNWERKNLERLPVFSIAQSEIKKNENEFVGKSIIDGIEFFLSKVGKEKLEKQKILLMGYGNVGKEVARNLNLLCKKLFVWDADSIKQTRAEIKYGKLEDLSKINIIIGVSGNTVLKFEDVEKLGNDVLLVSGSSKQIEFDIESFIDNADKVEIDKHFLGFHFGYKKITVANYGEPINLRYSVVPSKILDMIYAALINCINRIDEGKAVAGLQGISIEDQTEISNQYAEIYKNKLYQMSYNITYEN